MPYSLILKKRQILNCSLLQNLGGALRVNFVNQAVRMVLLYILCSLISIIFIHSIKNNSYVSFFFMLYVPVNNFSVM